MSREAQLLNLLRQVLQFSNDVTCLSASHRRNQYHQPGEPCPKVAAWEGLIEEIRKEVTK